MRTHAQRLTPLNVLRRCLTNLTRKQRLLVVLSSCRIIRVFRSLLASALRPYPLTTALMTRFQPNPKTTSRPSLVRNRPTSFPVRYLRLKIPKQRLSKRSEERRVGQGQRLERMADDLRVIQ